MDFDYEKWAINLLDDDSIERNVKLKRIKDKFREIIDSKEKTKAEKLFKISLLSSVVSEINEKSIDELLELAFFNFDNKICCSEQIPDAEEPYKKVEKIIESWD